MTYRKPLAIAVLLASIVAPMFAVDHRCPQPSGLFSLSATTATHVVCMVDVPIQGSYALWSVPLVGGAPVRLSPEMATDRDVIRFLVSPDGLRVAYAADPVKWTQYELYSVQVTGGASAKLSGSMPSDNDVDDFAWSGDSSRVAYRKGRNATGAWVLYSASAFGGGSVQLSQSGGAVGRGVTASGEFVRYKFGADGVEDWWRVLFTGGSPQMAIFADGFETGNQGGWR